MRGLGFFLRRSFEKIFYLFLAARDLTAARELPLVVASRSYSRCSAQASHCGGFSCCFRVPALEFGLQQLWHMGLSCSAACGIFSHQGLNPHLLHWQVHFFTGPLRKSQDGGLGGLKMAFFVEIQNYVLM